MRFWPFKRRSKLTEDETNLGRILVEVMDVCTQKELDFAVQLHRDTGRMLGECLIESGHITPDHLATALRLQKKLRNGAATDALLEALNTRADRKAASLERRKLATAR